MINLVTLTQAKSQLRITSSDADYDIILKVQAGSAILMNYLKLTEPHEDWYNDSSPPALVVPGEIQQAALLIIAELYENREASTSNPLSIAVKSLVHRWRDPALA